MQRASTAAHAYHRSVLRASARPLAAQLLALAERVETDNFRTSGTCPQKGTF